MADEYAEDYEPEEVDADEPNKPKEQKKDNLPEIKKNTPMLPTKANMSKDATSRFC